MNIDDFVKNEIKKNIDLKYKEFSNKLCMSKYQMLGVRIPILKNIAKKLSKSEGFTIDKKCEYITSINDNCSFEEVMIKGFLIEYIKEININNRLNILQQYVQYIDNWSVCDSVCANLKFVNKNKEEIFDFLQQYLNSDKEFYQRFLIVVLMDYYINDEYIDKVLTIYKNISFKLKEYYAKMALAWAISKVYIYYKDKALEFLRNGNLDDFTYNKSISKICDSLRVSKQEKDILRNMYRKSKE